MPTYEYKCDKCENIFEVFQSISADPISDCPDEKCEGNVSKLISRGSGFVLKGSGFYQTDYKSDSYNKDKKADSGSSCGSSEACSTCPAANNS